MVNIVQNLRREYVMSPAGERTGEIAAHSTPEDTVMAHPVGAVERAMKVQEVIVRALSGQLTWPPAEGHPRA